MAAVRWILFDSNNNAVAQFDEPPTTWVLREHGTRYTYRDGTYVLCVNENFLANLAPPPFAPEAPQSSDLPGSTPEG